MRYLAFSDPSFSEEERTTCKLERPNKLSFQLPIFPPTRIEQTHSRVDWKRMWIKLASHRNLGILKLVVGQVIESYVID